MKAFQKNFVLPAPALRYRPHLIAKPSGGKRQVFAPCAILRTIQDSLLPELWEKLPASPHSHARPGRSILTHAQIHQAPAVLLTMDLASFFDHVTAGRVRQVFTSAFPNTQVDKLVDICVMPTSDRIATGAPTSPPVADAAFYTADWLIAELAEANGWRYSRYVDDLAFSLPKNVAIRPGDDRVVTMRYFVAAVTKSMGFPINPNKTRVAFPWHQQEVTGLIVNHGPPRAGRHYWKRLRGGLHRLECGQPVDTEALRGLLQFLCMVSKDRAHPYQERFDKAVKR